VVRLFLNTQQSRAFQHSPSVHSKGDRCMKLKLIAAATIAAGVALSGCAHKGNDASAGGSRSATETAGDAALTAKVKTALATAAGLGTAANVNVQSYRGVVQLNGFVGSPEQIQLARSKRPEVILIDIDLLDFDLDRSPGEIVRRLHGDPAIEWIPILALSANAAPAAILKGLEAGFFQYLTKPIQTTAFTEALAF